MALGLPAINASNEVGVLGTTATSIKSLTDGSHLSVLDHFFGKATAVGMSAASSDQDYIYKSYFEIWREIGNLSAKTFR